MATLTVQELPQNGATGGAITFAAADVAGDTFLPALEVPAAMFVADTTP